MEIMRLNSDNMMGIICVYNNEKILNEYLIRGLNNQKDNNFNLFLVDNRNNKFKSAAAAFNYAASKVDAEYLVFTHQDIYLPEGWVVETEKIIKSLKNPGVIGVAGKSLFDYNILTNIEHDTPPRKPNPSIPISNPVEVETVDECLFIIPKSVFDENKFDTTCCDGWHLYGADYCLDMKNKGYNVYVIPTYLYHVSNGDFRFYYESLDKFLKKHKANLIIPTTCGNWITYHSNLNNESPALKNKIIDQSINKDIPFKQENISYEHYFCKICEIEIIKNKLEKSENLKSKMDIRYNQKDKEYKELKNKYNQLNKKYKGIINSNSWKITSILRKFKKSFN
ncbi:glycosyltransferase [Methanobrevibacter filiformis]|uniref:Glycosyl transferase family 2 n=1 Tax=Methanobrevibacter filiformis TaxID=55758 RepID=A0A162FAI5_9EURY|nr:glycosyltransferase [Methanobrevibacter filiformis]KZX10265.1 glycosyl transferase family 2 [Methanobrevibacter filiformis]